jgi:hypothetical protein
MSTGLMERISAGVALVAVAALVLLTAVIGGGPVELSTPPPLLQALLVTHAVLVPLVVVGVGLGGVVLIRQGERAGRLAVIGVVGGGAYLFVLSLLMATLVTGI